MKDVGLRIRVQRGLRDRFMAACRAQDKPAAQVLREFMHAYVAEHGVAAGNEEKAIPSETVEPPKVSRKPA